MAQFERRDGARCTRSLYVRDPVTLDYARLPADEATSLESPVVARELPDVFVNVMHVDERGRGDWLHVARVHLETGVSDVLLTPDELRAFCGAGPKWPCQRPCRLRRGSLPLAFAGPCAGC